MKNVKLINISILISFIILTIQCNLRKANENHNLSDSTNYALAPPIDSNKIVKYPDPHFKYFSFDTIIIFKLDSYKIVSKKMKWKVKFEISKNEKFQYKDSCDIYGPYLFGMEDFDGNGYPDLRIDSRNNRNIMTDIYLWDTISSKYYFLDEFHCVESLKPNYFITINYYGASDFVCDFYHLSLDKKYKNFNSFHIFYGNDSIESYISSKDTTIYTKYDIDKCYEILNNYRDKIKNTP